MKKLSEITEQDLIEHKNWRVFRDQVNCEFIEYDDSIKDLDYGWYLTGTKYSLSDGTILEGFVVDLYQQSGHWVFIEGELFPFGDWSPVTKKVCDSISKILKKPKKDIFPVKYECNLTHWGRRVSGVLEN